MRLFVAVKLPDDVLTRLQTIQRRYLSVPSIRIERSEKLHLTLLYIGETERKEEVISSMRGITFEPFEITLETVGMFRNSQYVYWAGVAPSSRLDELAADVLLHAKTAFPLLQYRFSPHITLARGKAKMPFSFDGVPISMKIDSFSLYESRDGNYIELAVFNKPRQ